MSGNYLLDTNIVIGVLSNDPSAVRGLTAADEVLIPAVVLGELFYGAMCSNNVEANLQRISELVSRYAILDVDGSTAVHYGQVRRALRAKGRPIPDNDVWIAALAMQLGWTLATRDHHFDELEGIITDAWRPM